MSTYLKLDVFEGPMDLLLYLIKKNNMDIMDIPVADITREFLAHIEVLKELNLDNVGEFLVMSSTLLQIKTRMLLPPAPEKESGEEGPDPRAELVAKLLEYQKFKEAASILAEKHTVQRDVYYRTEPEFSKDEFLLEVSVYDLLNAFKDILKRARDEVKEILYDDIPIETKIREILVALDKREYMSFDEIFGSETRKMGLITAFLAMLELMRTKQIIARQAGKFGGIRIYRYRQSESEMAAEEAGDASVLPQVQEEKMES